MVHERLRTTLLRTGLRTDNKQGQGNQDMPKNTNEGLEHAGEISGERSPAYINAFRVVNVPGVHT